MHFVLVRYAKISAIFYTKISDYSSLGFPRFVRCLAVTILVFPFGESHFSSLLHLECSFADQ